MKRKVKDRSVELKIEKVWETLSLRYFNLQLKNLAIV